MPAGDGRGTIPVFVLGGGEMRRWWIGAGVGAAVVGAGLLARRACGANRAGFDFGKMVERMPENAPPKWMFRNISAIRKNTEQIRGIRKNTERILELLETEHAPATGEHVGTAA